MTRTWTEIRPYEWPNLSNEERTRLARECRKNYAILKIPESEPQWDHARYRDLPKPAGPSTSSAEPKRGITSRDAKKKATEAPPRRANDVITARDERVQPSRSRPEPPSHAGSSNALRAAPRKPPGSGYKSKAGSNAPSTPDPDNLPAAPASLPRKPDFSSSSHPSHAPPSHDRAPSNSGPDKGPSRLPPKPRDPVPSTSTHSHAAEVKTERQEINFKRKASAIRDDHETEMSDRDRDRSKPPMMKRRKIGDVNGSSSTSTPVHQRTPSLPNKPSTATQDAAVRPPSRSIKKESSPMPSLSGRSPLPPGRSPLAHHRVAAQDRMAPSASSSSSQSRHAPPPQTSHTHKSGSSKPRRKSPIYTSSEDEQEPPPPKPSRLVVAPPVPSPLPRPISPKKTRALREDGPPKLRDNGPLKLPDDERGLKKLYREKHKPYVALWTRHYKAHTYITNLLEDEDAPTDSDVDVDIDNQDELRQLKHDLDEAVEELTMIQEHYNKVVKSKRDVGKYSDEE